MCRGRGSNPHAPCGTRDFKSRASASFATPANNLRGFRARQSQNLTDRVYTVLPDRSCSQGPAQTSNHPTADTGSPIRQPILSSTRFHRRTAAREVHTDDRHSHRVQSAESWYKQQLRGGQSRSMDRLGLDPVIKDLFESFHSTLDLRRRAEADKRWGPIKAFWANLRAIEVGPRTFRDFYQCGNARSPGYSWPETTGSDSGVRRVHPLAADAPTATVSDLAASWGVSKSTAARWLASGRVTSVGQTPVGHLSLSPAITPVS